MSHYFQWGSNPSNIPGMLFWAKLKNCIPFLENSPATTISGGEQGEREKWENQLAAWKKHNFCFLWAEKRRMCFMRIVHCDCDWLWWNTNRIQSPGSREREDVVPGGFQQLPANKFWASRIGQNPKPITWPSTMRFSEEMKCRMSAIFILAAFEEVIDI